MCRKIRVPARYMLEFQQDLGGEQHCWLTMDDRAAYCWEREGIAHKILCTAGIHSHSDLYCLHTLYGLRSGLVRTRTLKSPQALDAVRLVGRARAIFKHKASWRCGWGLRRWIHCTQNTQRRMGRRALHNREGSVLGKASRWLLRSRRVAGHVS